MMFNTIALLLVISTLIVAGCDISSGGRTDSQDKCTITFNNAMGTTQTYNGEYVVFKDNNNTICCIIGGYDDPDKINNFGAKAFCGTKG